MPMPTCRCWRHCLAGQDGSLGGDPGRIAGVVGSDQSVVRGLAAEQVVHVVTYLKFKIGLFGINGLLGIFYQRLWNHDWIQQQLRVFLEYLTF